jgi:ABC-type uncharacterized transport system permease subunit
MEEIQIAGLGAKEGEVRANLQPLVRAPAFGRATFLPILLPAGAILAALLLFAGFCALAGANPWAVYHSIYRGAFGSWYAWQNTLVRAAPLMLCALCTAIPAQLGLVVIGGEGALVMGGLCATLAGLALPNAPAWQVQLSMALTGMLMGGCWILAVGALKYYRGVNETISSLMMNYVAIALLNQAINTWVRDPGSLNKPASYPLADEQMMQPFGDTSIHAGLLFGVVACIAAWVLIRKTTFGFAMRTLGANVRAAQVAGLPVGKIILVSCFLAGIGPGLAGMVEVAAIHGRANESLNSWYGYSGILVAFVARQNPAGCIVVSVLLGGLLAAGGSLQREHHLPDATITVFQGIVFLTILFSESLRGQTHLRSTR